MFPLTRVALTIVLLIIVWHHAHWSVALALTLIFVTEECANVVSNINAKRFKQNPTIQRLLRNAEERKKNAAA